jgi:hypothetical protein
MTHTYIYMGVCVCCMAQQPPIEPGPPPYRGFTITHRHTTFGRMSSPKQRPLPDNTQQSQQTDIHAPGGIRTRYSSKRTAVDPRLRLRGQWDRQQLIYAVTKLSANKKKKTFSSQLQIYEACPESKDTSRVGRWGNFLCLLWQHWRRP